MTVQDKPARGDNRALMWLGHHSAPIVVSWAAASVAYNATAQPSVLTWPDLAVNAVFITSILSDFGYHSDRLCERCIAATPLDPQAAVSRWKPALRLFHARRIVGFALIATIAWWFGSPWLYHVHHIPWWVYAGNTVALLATAGYLLSSHIHRRLYPWCPWCHWDDGGDAEISPDLPVVPQEL